MKEEEKKINKATFKESMEIIQRAEEIAKDLKENFITEFIEDGFDQKTAKQAVKMLLKKAWKEFYRQEIPEMSGDKLLEMEKADGEIKTILDKKRKQGVKDDDIRWWWNKHDLERKMIELSEAFLRDIIYKRLIGRGKTKEDSLERVKKSFVCYFHSKKLNSVDNEETIVPIELNKRINEYLERRAEENPEQYLKDLEEMGTLTALVRKEIANGNL